MSDNVPDKRTWFHDGLTPNLGMVHRVETYLYSGHSAYQAIEVIKTRSFGTCLVLDGKIQSSEADEFVYHEALVQPVMVTHPFPRSVLVAGGGEGATLREVLRHLSVEKATMVDLDDEVVKVCRQYLPSFSAGAMFILTFSALSSAKSLYSSSGAPSLSPRPAISLIFLPQTPFVGSVRPTAS